MDGRSRVLSDVSESELLEDEKFEDALEIQPDQEIICSNRKDLENSSPKKFSGEDTKQKAEPVEEVMQQPVSEQENGHVKTRQESVDKGKGQTGTRERRFKDMKSIQTIEASSSKKALWCMKFSPCGRFIATGGADCEVRVWCSRSHLFDIERQQGEAPKEPDSFNGFSPEPFVIFKGHKNEILDLVWTEDSNLFSCGMDKDVKLWSLATKNCVATLRHDASVSSAKLLPKNRNFLATITCEGHLRLWDVQHRIVAGEIKDNLCTALEVIEDDSIIVVGTTDGRLLFFTKTLASNSSLTISDKKPKVFDICSLGEKLLVSTDDSKTRMYNSKTRQLLMKFNGASHVNSLTRVGFSRDSQFVISGAEDSCLYFFATNSPLPTQKNEQKYADKTKVGRSAITVALFAPKPELLLKNENSPTTDVIICVDCTGTLSVYTSNPIDM